ncbi:hypothetical protein [uncultured Dokdonia sp.]|uniref:hypothetical protein n=1 Tax=uncultured Dokdonia sp. TaxID=575653 RepID=UPI00263872AE|nr:hypothetical protein [uncultured Dokdonia sp.]
MTLELKMPLSQKYLWRFVLLFLLFFCFPYDMTYGMTYALEDWHLWDTPIFWLADVLFNWELSIDTRYIGFDSRYEVVRYTLCFLLANLGTLIWLLIDYKYKTSYNQKLKNLVQTILRYHIAFIILTYGLSKVVDIQFGVMSMDTLDKNIGNSSAMGFMWDFFSYSQTVTRFSGWLEVIGGVLLFFRRTTFLGLTLLVIVMANVVIFDIGYNVSVTIYAIYILVLILILLSDQFVSIYNYLILNKTTTPVRYKRLFVNDKTYARAKIFKIALLLVMSSLFFYQFSTYANLMKKDQSWFTNKQTVETFIRNGDTISNDTDEKRWKEINFNTTNVYPNSFEIIYHTKKTERLAFTIDTLTKTLNYSDFIDPTPQYELFSKIDDSIEKNRTWKSLKYSKRGDTATVWTGIFKKDTLHIETSVKRLEDYPLMKRRGRWLFDL